MTSEMVTIYFDGAIWPNPHGEAGCGFVAYVDGKRIKSSGRWVGRGKGLSNNVAEYEGLIDALQWVRKFHRDSEVKIFGDSLLVIKQMSYQLTPVSGYYIGRYLIARTLSFGLKVSYQWIPREKNMEADAIASRARRSGPIPV